MRKKILLSVLGVFVLICSLVVTASGKPKPTGDLVIAISDLGREYWSVTESTIIEMYPASMWYDKLLYRGTGTDETLGPGLAESWTISDDGLTYTFNIRKDVEFNEGWGPFTAEDVLYTFELIGREGVDVGARIVNDYIESMEVVSRYVFKVKLKKPHPDFLYWISSFYPYFSIVSKKYYKQVGLDQAAKHPVGTGPFIFKEHMLGNYLKVEAVESHWRKTSEFETVTIKIVPDEGSRIATLKAGDADIISLSTGFVGEVESAEFNILKNSGASYYAIIFGGQVLPGREGYDPTSPWASLEDPERSLKVRKALCLAINKQEIIDYILKRQGIQNAVVEFIPGGVNTNPAWEPYPYDPEEAKRLLAEAGYPDGFEKPIQMYSFKLSGREELPDVAESVAMYWEAIGLKVDRVPTTWGMWWPEWKDRGKILRWGTTAIGWTPYVEPIMFWSQVASTETSAFFTHESYETDQYISDVTNATDTETRIQKHWTLGQYLYDNYYCSPIAVKDSLWGVSKKVSGWSLNSLNSYLHNVEYIQKP